MDETIPGGIYLDVHGIYRDAWGRIIEPPMSAAQPQDEGHETEVKKATEDKKKKSKEVTNE